MGALRPYLLLALAVAIGVALAPYVGGLLLLLMGGAVVFGLLRIARPYALPILATGAAVLCVLGIAAIIRDPRSTAAQWTELVVGFAVASVIWNAMQADTKRRAVDITSDS